MDHSAQGHPYLVVLDQREVAPGRLRSLLRSNHAASSEVSFFVAEVDRWVDCGRNQHRAAEAFAGGVLEPW